MLPWLWVSTIQLPLMLISLLLKVFYNILLDHSSSLLNMALTLQSFPHLFKKLQGCSLTDADWATDEKDQKSISGYCFYFLNSLVSWSSVKQKTMVLSSTESEYYAMTHAMKEGLWFRLFLKLHNLPVPHPFPLLCDNQSTLALIQSKSVSSCSKHIDVQYHFIRGHVSNGTFSTTWIPTEDMTADILTKPLPFPLFCKHCLSLGLIST